MADRKELLQRARRRAGLTQAQLAQRAGVGKDTVGSYERGVREPTRQTLRAVVEALDLPRAEADAILMEAGFERLPPRRMEAMERRSRPLAAIQREIDGYTWPSLVTNERYEIVAWNPPALKVAEMDFARDLPTPRERNLMRITCMPHYAAGRVVNWNEVAAFLIALYKHIQASIERPEEDTRYFETLVQDIAMSYPLTFGKVMELWPGVEPWREGRRPGLPIAWQADDGTRLRFNCLLGTWSDFDATWSFDWHPADAATWDWLGAPSVLGRSAARPRRARRRLASAAPGTLDWNRRLAEARRSSGLTQAELAAVAGLSKDAIASYETGRVRPSRDAVIAVARGMVLDTTTTNVILSALDLPPEPSDWSRLLCGLPLAGNSNWYSHSGAARRSIADITGEIDEHTWPCLILNDHCEIECWNEAAARVCGPDLARPARSTDTWHVVAFMARDRMRDRIANWEDVITAVVPDAARRHIASATIDPAPERLQGAITSIRDEDASVFARLGALWSAAPAAPPSLRVTFPVVWRHDDGSTLIFNGIISEWSAYERRWAIDWHPADAETWRWLESRLA